MSTPLVDGYGRPVYSGGSSPYESPSQSLYTHARPWLDDDIVTLMTEYRSRIMRADCRYISMWEDVHAALTQKCDYVSASHFRPYFTGEDEKWGMEAEAFLQGAENLADVRGAPWTYRNIWKIGSRLMDVDGDFVILLAKTANGFPLAQCLESHRIGTRYASPSTVAGGPYDGATIRSGLIYDDAGRLLAARVLAPLAENDKDIPASDLIYVANPIWFSEGRPMSSLAFAISSLYLSHETRAAEHIGIRANSALAIIEENETGNAPRTPTTGLRSESGLKTEILDSGLIRYIKSGGKGKITAHTSARPGDAWLNFQELVNSRSILALGWRLEMLDPKALKGAATRAFQDCINTAIMSRFFDLAAVAKRFTQWRVASFMQRGLISQSPEWDKWDIALPPEFLVDEGKTRQADRDDLRVGVQSEPEILRRYNLRPREFLTQRAKYLKMKRETAEKYGLEVPELGDLSQPGDRFVGNLYPGSAPVDGPPPDNGGKTP